MDSLDTIKDQAARIKEIEDAQMAIYRDNLIIYSERDEARAELIEARAEIDRLQNDCNKYYDLGHNRTIQLRYAQEELAKARAEIERLKGMMDDEHPDPGRFWQSP